MAFVSDILWREIRRAPPHVQEVLDKIPDENVESVMSDSQTRRLRDAYIAAGVVGGTSLMDAHHVAIALINEVDVILSWNFKHMVNPARIHRFHEVNRAWGLPLIESRSPYELGD